MNEYLKYLGFLVILFFISISCKEKKIITLKPAGFEQLKRASVENGKLKAVFVDNTEFPPDHKAGYSGIAELYHSDQDSSIFVPSYAGFNLEHIFSGDSLIQFFEPRINPMALYQKSNTEVLLYQVETPVSGAESLTEFKLEPPFYIDITFRCIFHNEKYLKHNYAGFFWASYINNPPDKNIYFRGVSEGQSVENWITGYSETHGLKSTHRAINDKYNFYFATDFKASLAYNYSDFRYSRPFYFGRFHNMAFAYFFDSREVIRFSQSPTGGGDTNPAWDFQYLIPDPDTGKEYSFRARIVYKPFVSNADIEEEYEKWIKK